MDRPTAPVRTCLLVTLITALGCAPGAGDVPPMLGHDAAECRVANVDAAAVCHRVRVRERADDPASRTFDLYAVVLPALGPSPPLEPLLVLQGGPGVAGTQLARSFATREVLRERHDLVFVDQRGTGQSNRLSCESLGRTNFLGTLLPAEHLVPCRERLARQADLAAYTNEASAVDLEALRQALGAERWSLYGISFGTRLAQSYARRFADRVHRMILDGVVPFDAELTGDLAESLERSIAYVAGRCDRDEVCARTSPKSHESIRRIAEQLDRSPAQVNVSDTTGIELAGAFGRWEFAYAIRGMLYGSQAANLPAMVSDVVRTADFGAFARLYQQRSRWPGDGTGQALHLGVYCAEDLPFIDSVRVRERLASTLMRDLYYRAYRDGCALWPMPAVADSLRRPWRSEIETLLFSGERDPVTPPAYGDRVAASLPRARHLVIPGGGHAESSPCKTGMMAAFLATGVLAGADVSCMGALDFPPFPPPR